MKFRTPRLSEVIALIGFIVLFALALSAGAEPVTFEVCGANAPIFKRNGDVLEVRCPGRDAPALAIYGCLDPKVKREGTRYTLSCSSWRPYEVRPK